MQMIDIRTLIIPLIHIKMNRISNLKLIDKRKSQSIYTKMTILLLSICIGEKLVWCVIVSMIFTIEE
jgi:hypothetical protein